MKKKIRNSVDIVFISDDMQDLGKKTLDMVGSDLTRFFGCNRALQQTSEQNLHFEQKLLVSFKFKGNLNGKKVIFKINLHNSGK